MKKIIPQKPLCLASPLEDPYFQRVRPLYAKYMEINEGIMITPAGESFPVQIVNLPWAMEKIGAVAPNDTESAQFKSESKIFPELWDRCPLVFISVKKLNNKINNMTNEKNSKENGKNVEVVMDEHTNKPVNIRFTFGERQQDFGIYSLGDVEVIYKNLDIATRMQFGLDAILAEAHYLFRNFETDEFISIPGIKEKMFQALYIDSVEHNVYPNFVQACIIGGEVLGGEAIHPPKGQAVMVSYGTDERYKPSMAAEFRSDELISLMKEYAENYSSDQINKKIKFWKENLVYAKQNLKTSIKKYLTEPIDAELDLLEEYRKDSEVNHTAHNIENSHKPYFPYLKFLREDQDKILFESLTKCDLLKKIGTDRYIFNGPITGLAATMNKLNDLEFISEAFTNAPILKQFVDQNGEEIIESNFARYRERARNQQAKISKRITPLFDLLIEYDNQARKMS